jgi:hypothetical protein
MQLCWQSSRYFASSSRVSTAFLHISLCSSHPDSLHSFEMYRHESFTSSFSNATRLLRTSRHNSLANTHVRTYLNRLSVCSRNFCRLNSKPFFSNNTYKNKYCRGFYSFVNLILRHKFIFNEQKNPFPIIDNNSSSESSLKRLSFSIQN